MGEPFSVTSLTSVRASAEALSADALRRLLRIYQSARCFWAAALEALDNPESVWRLTGEEFEVRLLRRKAAFDHAILAFDIIALRFEERFGPLEQRMETELL